MKTLLICNLSWQWVALIGWFALLFAICIILRQFYLRKYVNFPELNHRHELKMKECSFEQEKYWFFQKELTKDFKKELENRIKGLEYEKNEIDKKLKEEKDDREEKLKKERLQAEHDFYKKITETFYSVKKTNDKKE